MKSAIQPDPRDYEIRIWYSATEGDDCYIAQVVQWPGIMAHGDTREEAAHEIQLALEGRSKSPSKPASRRPSRRLLTLRKLARSPFR